MMRTLRSELAKLKRSRMILWTALVIIGYTSIGLAMFPILEDLQANAAPVSGGDVFAQAGIVEINWETAMRFIPMGVSGAWGVMLVSLIAAYVFGRELREGTDISTATLPIRRESFVFAKLAVVALWTIGLAVLAVVTAVGVDALYMGFDGFRMSYVWGALADTLHALLPLYLTVPVIAWLSLTRRGYLRPMLFALVVFTVANSLIGLDAAAYFPWSMPIALVGVTWMPLAGQLTLVSWMIAIAVFAGGLFAVLRRTNRADSAA